MVGECQNSLLRHGRDRVVSDERLDITYIAISGILHAGASPQQPLRTGAFTAQPFPSLASYRF